MNLSGIKIKKEEAKRLNALSKKYFEMVDWEPFFNLMRAYFPDCTIKSDESMVGYQRPQHGHFVYNNDTIIMSTMICFSESKPVYYFPGVDLQIACEDLRSTYSLDELAEMLKKARASGKI